jgi:signal transduction histidine kinase
VQIEVTIPGEDEARYLQSVEHHIYRMVQEACENAIRHGQTGHIIISGELAAGYINLSIEDDGKGFDASASLRLDSLLANKHFGLAGMVERALLIGADVRIDSTPGKGTKITIFWKPSI